MELIPKEISSSTRNTIPFNVKFDSLLEKYEDQGIYKLFYKHNFSISLEDGTNYPAHIIIFHQEWTPPFYSLLKPNLTTLLEPTKIGFALIMENEEMKNANLDLDFQLTINERIQLQTCEAKILGERATYYLDETSQWVKNVYAIQHLFKNIKQLNSVKGKITISFETKSSFRQELIHTLGLNLVTPGGKEDFTIICKGQKIKFEKQVLINVSSVFRGMLESPWSEESKTGRVEIKEVEPETILAFKNILLNGNDFKKEDLNIDVMIFADRYDIKGLFDLCGKYVDYFDVNDENLFETVQGLYLFKNDSFVNEAILLMKKKHEVLKQDSRWEEFAKNIPDYDLIVSNILLSPSSP